MIIIRSCREIQESIVLQVQRSSRPIEFKAGINSSKVERSEVATIAKYLRRS